MIYSKIAFIILLIVTALSINFANGQDRNEFEDELRRLEVQDETLLNKVEKISNQNDDLITDTVSVGNAATTREILNEETIIPKTKERRVRSR